MTVLFTNFSAGPDGTDVSVANSAAPGDDALDVVTKVQGSSGVGSYVKYKNAIDRPTSEFAMETTTGGVTGVPTAFVTWSTSMGAKTTVYTRWYARFSDIPTDSTTSNDNVLFMIWSTSTHCCSVWVDNTTNNKIGQPFILDGPGSGYTWMATALSPDVWHRFEFRATLSATVGSAELRLYADPNADDETPTETLTVTGKNFSAATGNKFQLGCANPLLNQTPTQHTGWELNDTGWPGPLPFRAGKGVPGIQAPFIAVHNDVF